MGAMNGAGGDSIIAGLSLPVALVEAIGDARWLAPTDLGLLRFVFRDEPSQPSFYDLAGIRGETLCWRDESEAETLAWYIGQPNLEDPPGDIDQSKSVIIGDLGPDRPIALDYRNSPARPRVIYLTSYNGWIEVATDIETLLGRLGLE